MVNVATQVCPTELTKNRAPPIPVELSEPPLGLYAHESVSQFVRSNELIQRIAIESWERLSRD